MSSQETTSVTDAASAGLTTTRLKTPVISLLRLLIAIVKNDAILRPLLGIRSGGSDPRIYRYYQPQAIVDSDNRAYITVAQTGWPERTQAVGSPVFNLAVWAIDWDVAESVRQRLFDLFDNKKRTTADGRDVFSSILLMHDNYQEDTKFASVVVQVRLGFSQV